MTYGQKVTLEAGSLYRRIDYYASGSSANAVFSQWQINDIYQGCGAFWKYSVSGDSNVTPYITFPEPGYSLSGSCYAISQCLRVRMYTYSMR